MARQILGKVVPTGEDTYDNNRTYDELCIVMYNGQSYISKKETRGNKPDNTEYWQQLVEKPVKGTDYFTEADKDEIVNDVTNDATNKYNQAVTTGIEKFDQNAERKTSDFNANASEKTDTYNANADSTTQAFTNNANSKTEAYNSNATEKLGTYNSNHTAKLKEYNDNATSKLSAYNTNTVTKTTEYNSNHTNKINTYNTNASNKVDAYNTNADARLEEYNTNADNKIAEYDEHSKELNNKIVSIGNDYRMVKDQLLYTGEDTDTFIHVEDSAMAEMKEIKVDGVCEQKTTTGKNKLDMSSLIATTSKKGITFTNNGDGTFNVSGTADTDVTLNLLSNTLNNVIESGKKYYLYSSQPYNLNSFNLSVILNTDNGTKYYITNQVGSSDFNTINNTQLALYIPAGQTINVTNVKLMLVESDVADNDFEPYTNGASPNPDYPQEIKTITDSLKVTSCDDGLFDGEFRQGSWNSINDNTRCFNKNNIYVEPGNYLLITNLDINNYRYGILVSDDNYPAQVENFSYDSGWKQANKFEFNLTETGNLGINVSSINNANINPSTFANVKWLLIKLDLVSIIEAKLPEGEFIGYINTTNRDILSTKYNRNAAVYQWVLNKYIAKITIDGTKGSFSMPSVGRFNIDNIISNYLKTSQSYGITTKCDNYISFPQTLSNSDFDKLTSGYNYGIGLGGGTANNIRIKNVNFSNVEDFKNDLKQHPITLYYILNTESRQTLDLGVIDMPMSYKDITNIFTDSDLLPTINVKYYRVFDKTIQNAQINEKTLKQEITDLNATVSALDTRLKALETKTVEEPTESEGTV